MTRATKNEVPPHDAETEKSFLGLVLARNDVLDEPGCELDETDFYIPSHRTIYRVAAEYREAGQVFDATTATDALGSHPDAVAVVLRIMDSGYQRASLDNAPGYAAAIREKAVSRRGVEQAKNYIRLAQAGANADDMRAARDAIPDPTAGPRRQCISYRTLSTVTPRPVEWLWPGRVPLGKLTMLAGDPGLGKSFATIYMAACVSVGRPWIDGSEARNIKGDVILLSAEDDPEDTIRPRLDEAGGDPRRVHVVDGVSAKARRGERPRSFALETDLPALEAMLDDFPETRLIVIDPISAYGNGSTDTHKNADVRAQLAGLEKLAQARHVAVVVVSHLNKSGGGKAVYRVSGSLAYMAAVRIGWLVAKDGDDESRRLMVQVKNNLAKDPGGLAFRVEEGRVEWEPNIIDVRADDLCASESREGDSSGRNEAEEFLRSELADGACPAQKIQDSGRDAGISAKNLRNARERICRTYKEGFDGGKWYWELRDTDTAENRRRRCPEIIEDAQDARARAGASSGIFEGEIEYFPAAPSVVEIPGNAA